MGKIRRERLHIDKSEYPLFAQHICQTKTIYFCVEHLKRMIGLVVAVFATLIVAGLSSVCFKMDFIWWNSLTKPAFVLSSAFWDSFVIVAYLSSIISITRLVEHKHIFPSMLFFALLGTSCVLFVFAFFTLKNLLAAIVFMTFTLAFAYVLFIRFMTKDVTLALIFTPTLLFDVYAFLCTLAILMAN